MVALSDAYYFLAGKRSEVRGHNSKNKGALPPAAPPVGPALILCFVPIACQCLHTKCQTRARPLTLNDCTFRITTPIELCFTSPKSLSVRQNHLGYSFKLFDDLMGNIWYAFVHRCIFSANKFVRWLHRSDAFQTFSLFSLYNASVCRQPNPVVAGALFHFLLLFSIASSSNYLSIYVLCSSNNPV